MILLLLSQGDKYYYVLVTSFSRLVAGRTKHACKTFVCPYCLHPFSYQHYLDNHLPACGQHLSQTVKYLKKGENILKFDKIQHMFPVPFVLYADFESYLTSSGEHVPSGFCCLRVSQFPEHDHNIFTYSGDNVLQNFFQHIKQEQDTINNILSTDLPINTLTDEESRAHDAATACFICENEFTITNVKTKHHCHIFMHVQQGLKSS